MEKFITVNGKIFKAVKTIFQDQITADGGAAPWMIGRTVKNSRTDIFNEAGEYLFTFGFSFKSFDKKEGYRNMIIRQISEMAS